MINNNAFSREELILFSRLQIDDDSLENWEHDLYSFILDYFDESVPLLQKTSGTTGDPKSLVLKRDALSISALNTIRHFELTPGDSVLLCLPVKYIAGKMMVVRALEGRLNLITVSPSGRPIENLHTDIDFAAMVPMQLNEIFAHNDPLDKIQTLLIGGGEISTQLRSEIHQLSGVQVYESFAMSETYSHFATRRISGTAPDKYFKVMENVSIDTDNRGCLLVSYPGVTDGTIQSNDLVEIHAKGEFEWLGRIDNVINSGGVKYIPEILEQKIRQFIPFECLIIALPDTKLGNKMVLLVEATSEDLKKEIWLRAMEKALQKFEIPKEIFAIEELPRNSATKFDRKAAREIAEKISNR